VQTIRAHAAAAENAGNFFGEDIFIASARPADEGVFDAAGVNVGVWPMALWHSDRWWRSPPWVALHRLDRRVARETAAANRREGGAS